MDTEENGDMNTMSIQNQAMTQISPQLRQRLLREKKSYHKLKQIFIKQFDASEENIYYLISVKFIQQWKSFTSYDQNNLQTISTHGVQPKLLNSDITKQTKGEYELLPDLLQNQDFHVVNQQIIDIFKQYPGVRIKRSSYKLSNGQKRVQIYPKKFHYFFLNQKICYAIDMGSPTKLKQFDIQKGSVSNYATCQEFKQVVSKLFQQKYKQTKPIDSIRIWKPNPQMNKNKYFDHVQTTCKKQQVHSYSVTPEAQIFDKDDQTVDQFGIKDGDLLIFQIKSETTTKQWVIKYGQYQQSCQFCRNYRVLKVVCGCKKVKYCCQECKYKDVKFHKKYCTLAQQQEMKQQINYEFTQSSNKGLTGLQNLGNTCFMNSCLQCLSNTQLLSKYFIQKRFVNEINRNNPIGTKGKLTLKYAKLIKSLWCGSDSSYSPYSLKSAIGQFQPIFSGYMQHDSQQLLSFLLDGLHEDLNRVLAKPYVQSIDSNGRPDQIVAKLSWENFLKRNKSIIVDLFMGQYKSKVICPDCAFQSITFDPFSNVSLPIPQITKQTIQSFIFYQNYRQTPKKITIQYRGDSINEWSSFASNLLKIDAQNLKFFILSFQGEVEQLTEKSSIQDIKQKINKEKKNLFCIEISNEEKRIQNNKKLRFDFKFVKITSQFIRTTKQTITFKRPFYFQLKNDLSGEQIYYKIFKFIHKPVISKISKSAVDEGDLRKSFEKYFESKQKYLFEIYLMTSKTISKSRFSQKTQVIYQKEKLINLKDNIKDLLNNGQIKQFEFEIRVSKFIKQQIKKLNTYEDFDRHKKNYDDQDKQYDFIDCLRQFRKREKLEKGNQWYCPKCKTHKQAYKQMSIYKSSKILVFHLKRFKQKSTFTKSKLNALVKYPLFLDLSQFIATKTLPQAYFYNTETATQIDISQSSKYQLYAVSNHYGGMGGGHYTAYAKNNGRWYDFNDSSVHKISQKQVVSSAGYLLFYKRI